MLHLRKHNQKPLQDEEGFRPLLVWAVVRLANYPIYNGGDSRARHTQTGSWYFHLAYSTASSSTTCTPNDNELCLLWPNMACMSSKYSGRYILWESHVDRWNGLTGYMLQFVSLKISDQDCRSSQSFPRISLTKDSLSCLSFYTCTVRQPWESV